MTRAEQNELFQEILSSTIDDVFFKMPSKRFDDKQTVQIEAECTVTWLQVNE